MTPSLPRLSAGKQGGTSSRTKAVEYTMWTNGLLSQRGIDSSLQLTRCIVLQRVRRQVHRDVVPCGEDIH